MAYLLANFQPQKSFNDDPYYELPSRWFQRHNTKPEVSLPVYDKDQLLNYFKHHIRTNELDVDFVLGALYYGLKDVFKEIVTLDEDWVSYNQTIMKAGVLKEHCVLDLVHHKTSTCVHQIPNTQSRFPVENLTWPNLIFVLVCCYKRNAFTRADDFIILEDLMNKHIKKYGTGITEMSQIPKTWSSFVHDIDFRKCMAAIDMFYFKFISSLNTNIRVITFSSKYKDCDALQDMLYTNSYLGLNNSELGEWIWYTFIKTDFDRITEDSAEIENQHSYLPYASDFALYQRQGSPFSYEENYVFYTFLNIVGVTCNQPKFVHRRFRPHLIPNHEKHLPMIILNAITMAYVLKSQDFSIYLEELTNRELDKVEKQMKAKMLKIDHSSDQEVPSASTPSTSSSIPQMPITKISADWKSYIHTSNVVNKSNRVILNAIETWKTYDRVQPDSFVGFLKHFDMSILEKLF